MCCYISNVFQMISERRGSAPPPRARSETQRYEMDGQIVILDDYNNFYFFELFPWNSSITPLSLPPPKESISIPDSDIQRRSSIGDTYLPDSYNSVCDEDKEDDKWLHEGCDGFFPLFKPGQHLQTAQRRKMNEDKQTAAHMCESQLPSCEAGCIRASMSQPDSKLLCAVFIVK